ncbi:MAG: hypothetical protein ABIP94_13390 [Planctomycetota bacterium]
MNVAPSTAGRPKVTTHRVVSPYLAQLTTPRDHTRWAQDLLVLLEAKK